MIGNHIISGPFAFEFAILKMGETFDKIKSLGIFMVFNVEKKKSQNEMSALFMNLTRE